MYSNPGPNPSPNLSLFITGIAPARCETPRMAVTVAGPGSVCGRHVSTPTVSQAPCCGIHKGHLQPLLHPVEDLVEFLLGHLAFLHQLGSLHGGASVPQHLQYLLLQVFSLVRGRWAAPK